MKKKTGLLLMAFLTVGLLFAAGLNQRIDIQGGVALGSNIAQAPTAQVPSIPSTVTYGGYSADVWQEISPAKQKKIGRWTINGNSGAGAVTFTWQTSPVVLYSNGTYYWRSDIQGTFTPTATPTVTPTVTRTPTVTSTPTVTPTQTNIPAGVQCGQVSVEGTGPVTVTGVQLLPGSQVLVSNVAGSPVTTSLNVTWTPGETEFVVNGGASGVIDLFDWCIFNPFGAFPAPTYTPTPDIP